MHQQVVFIVGNITDLFPRLLTHQSPVPRTIKHIREHHRVYQEILEGNVLQQQRKVHVVVEKHQQVVFIVGNITNKLGYLNSRNVSKYIEAMKYLLLLLSLVKILLQEILIVQ